MADDPDHVAEQEPAGAPEQAVDASAEKPSLETPEGKTARAAIPAIYVDTWFLSTWRGHVRVTFGEEVAGLDVWRNAIVLEQLDAERLCRQMLRMIERRKAREMATSEEDAGAVRSQ